MSPLKYMGNSVTSCLLFLAYFSPSKVYSNSLRSDRYILTSGYVNTNNTKDCINSTLLSGIDNFHNIAELNDNNNITNLSQYLTDINMDNNSISALSKSNKDIPSDNIMDSVEKGYKVSKDSVTIIEDSMDLSKNFVGILKDSVDISNDSIHDMLNNSLVISENYIENLDSIDIEELVAVPELMQYGYKLRRKMPVIKSIRPIRPRRRTRGREPSSYPETVTFINEEDFVEMWEPYWDYELYNYILNKRKN
ncbi:uncharacterized protein CMU_037480 [Cryptosporidium muris RN66]|uniref:Uncharacterized protein n=1 Tax=Cryptosporidium muris (strain RN66) TaxID=441375 RepID=B6AH83_CRYMR|nr:uncharacterized protein CMU_037480 [Cryptosporidium muris RN66]EEA07574.1 hypothetical protein CMU_037480 [Cryptosporidium muris RN66]|eukprot:XP_002141923.1 hypothetical protein [Cryptosporidium muris RN66]